MSPRRPVIAVIGSLNVDLVTRTSRVPSAGETLTAESFDIGFGGKGANQAVACARLCCKQPQSEDAQPEKLLDVEVRMVGAVGGQHDQFAKPLLESLSRDGVDVSKVQQLPDQRTGVAVILVEEQTGENRILLNPGANHGFPAAGLVDQDVDVAIFQLEVPLPVVLQAMKDAKARGASVILNPAPAVPLPDGVYCQLDHLIMNETEAAILSERKVEAMDTGSDEELAAIASDFIRRGVQNVIITLGAQGVYYHTSSSAGKRIPARKVKVVDTTAAGDTFVGAYAVEVVRSKLRAESFGPEKAVEGANAAAAMTVQKKGAQASIPWADEVDSS